MGYAEYDSGRKFSKNPFRRAAYCLVQTMRSGEAGDWFSIFVPPVHNFGTFWSAKDNRTFNQLRTIDPTKYSKRS